jgi:ElaB/YqjD/DUF883 family membrane-anchored ribosome-binding protein
MERPEGLENDLRALGEQMGPRLEEAKERLRDVNQRVIAFIEERPGTSLLVALAVGFLIGRMVRR